MSDLNFLNNEEDKRLNKEKSPLLTVTDYDIKMPKLITDETTTYDNFKTNNDELQNFKQELINKKNRENLFKNMTSLSYEVSDFLGIR